MMNCPTGAAYARSFCHFRCEPNTSPFPPLVVEAMKMENELGSPKAGRVKEVAVSAGASVEAGRLLVIVE